MITRQRESVLVVLILGLSFRCLEKYVETLFSERREFFFVCVSIVLKSRLKLCFLREEVYILLDWGWPLENVALYVLEHEAIIMTTGQDW